MGKNQNKIQIQKSCGKKIAQNQFLESELLYPMGH